MSPSTSASVMLVAQIYVSVFYDRHFFLWSREQKKGGLRGSITQQAKRGGGRGEDQEAAGEIFYLCCFAPQRILSCKPATPLLGTRVAFTISTTFRTLENADGNPVGDTTRRVLFLFPSFFFFCSAPCEYRAFYFQVIYLWPLTRNASLVRFLKLNGPNGLYGKSPLCVIV